MTRSVPSTPDDVARATPALAVIGLGQLGAFFAHAALRAGITVLPVVRGQSIPARLTPLPEGAPILVATGEGSLPGVLDALPQDRRPDTILVQNGIGPALWRSRGFEPTVAVVWSVVKPGQPLRIGRRTGIAGRHAALVKALGEAAGIPGAILDPNDLPGELVAKHAFILTINALGLGADRTCGEWLATDRATCATVAEESLDVAAAAVGVEAVRPDGGVDAILETMTALADMPARGRTAADRLQQAVQTAESNLIDAPTLRAIARDCFPAAR